jgi:hypothetical protein
MAFVCRDRIHVLPLNGKGAPTVLSKRTSENGVLGTRPPLQYA